MNYCRLFIYITGITGLLTLSEQSYAAPGCDFASGSFVKNYLAPISTSISVPRNAATGPIGSEILVSSGGPQTNITCTYSSNGVLYDMAMLVSPGAATSIATIYQTNVPGIGFRLRTDGPSSSNVAVQNTPTDLGSHGSITFANTVRTESAKIRKVSVQFYVTGPVTPGNVIFHSPTLSAAIGPNYKSLTGAVIFSNLMITGSVPVTVLACETPDISVDLKKHESAEFPNVGSTSSATNFNFVIKNCPSKLNSVNYTFKPASGITLKGSGTGQYLTLDSGSTAKGVGVQVLYGNGTNVPFNTKTKYTGYSTSTGGSYTIPMKARYIRTGAISPGTANSAVEFDMSYE